MLQVEVNLFIVLIAAVVNMVVGFIWYHPQVFGKAWMEAIGKTQKDLEGMKKEANKAYALSFLGALVMSYVLANFVFYSQATNFKEGLVTGFLLWLGFIATIAWNNYLFEQKPKKLVLINSGYYLAALICMSIVLALWS